MKRKQESPHAKGPSSKDRRSSLSSASAPPLFSLNLKIEPSPPIDTASPVETKTEDAPQAETKLENIHKGISCDGRDYKYSRVNGDGSIYYRCWKVKTTGCKSTVTVAEDGTMTFRNVCSCPSLGKEIKKMGEIIDAVQPMKEFVKLHLYEYASRPPYAAAKAIHEHFEELYKGRAFNGLRVDQITNLVRNLRRYLSPSLFPLPHFSPSAGRVRGAIASASRRFQLWAPTMTVSGSSSSTTGTLLVGRRASCIISLVGLTQVCVISI